MTDIVFTLSAESKMDNIELRYALRSIDKFAKNLGKVFIYGPVLPSWVTNVEWVPMGDPCKNCKDVNLIEKIIAAAKNPEVASRFMFWSDDQLLTRELDLDQAPVVYNIRGIQEFFDKKNKWHMRMKHTLEYLRDHGHHYDCNFDSHVPQPYRKSDVEYVFSMVPYKKLPGFCINTIYFGMLDYPKNVNQVNVKVTLEKEGDGFNKLLLYMGYNDKALFGGLKEWLETFLPERSKFEKC